jgi:hypothetical protein
MAFVANGCHFQTLYVLFGLFKVCPNSRVAGFSILGVSLLMLESSIGSCYNGSISLSISGSHQEKVGYYGPIHSLAHSQVAWVWRTLARAALYAHEVSGST